MDKIIFVLSIISGAGGFGGLVYGIFSKNTYKLRLPFYGNLVEIGFFGDILVGIAASITVFFIAGPLFSLKLTEISDPECYIKIIALGVLSGFTGIRLLSGMSTKLIEKISTIDERLDQVEKQDQVSELLRQADFLLNNNPDRSLIIYNKALKVDPRNEAALIGKAKALRRKERWDDAITILDTITNKNPNAERAYYNRACYKHLSKQYSKGDVMQDLKKAVELFEFYKDYALDDPDFQRIVGS